MLSLIVVGIIPSVIAALFLSRSYKSRAVSIREMNLKTQCDILCSSYLSKGDLNSVVVNSELMLLSSIYSGRLMVIDRNFRVAKDTYDLDTGKISVSGEVMSCFAEGRGTTLYDQNNEYIELTTPITNENNEVTGVLLASISTNEIVQNCRYLEQRALIVIILLSVIVLVAGALFAELLVRPFKDVTSAIEDVTDGFEDQAISVRAYAETEQITEAFNKMLKRVRAVDNSRQEFVSNVSHELKTPLASMKVLADSINGQEDVPIEIYREFMSDITNEIDRETDIINDLLSLVRMDKKAATMKVARTNITELLENVVKTIRPLGLKKEVTITVKESKEVFAEVDATKLSLAISNLIENAVKYNKEQGAVEVSLKDDRKYFYLTVSDTGIGIPEDQKEMIFERFYRVDKSHSNKIEGNGLGLAITKSAISLHRGSIRVESKAGEGTTFRVRIPLVYETDEV